MVFSPRTMGFNPPSAFADLLPHCRSKEEIKLMSRIMRRGINVFNVSSSLETMQLSQIRLMSGMPT